jgi:ribonuclease HIII
LSVVLLFDPQRVEELRAFLRAGDFRFEERPHAFFFARREGVNVQAFTSGKLVVAGAQQQEYAGVLAGRGLARREGAAGDILAGPHAGSDEAGKGDYFGPLVVACVFVPDAATARDLREKGVRDSKAVGAANVGPLASLVRARCPHKVVRLDPPKYNELDASIGNVNELLAWAHARAIEDLLAEVGDVPVVVDQFKEGVLARHLMERGRRARVVEETKAERDVAVAAASLVARAEFVAAMAALSTRFGVTLPLGATHVDDAGRAFVARHGAEALREVAKVRFANTARVLRG